MSHKKQRLVLKYGGEEQFFNQKKLVRALMRSGATEQLAYEISERVLNKIVDRRIRTSQIYSLAKRYLRQASPVLAARYSLRRAIYSLGPAGYDFEKYIMLLFREYGYKTYLPATLSGECIQQEVDVILEKDNKTSMVECKLRHSNEIFVHLKDAMANYARFLDLQAGAQKNLCPKIDEAWMVTNSRFSPDAYNYGVCKKMKMISWNTPADQPLPYYIDRKNLYPVTILLRIKKYHLAALSRAQILLLKDLLAYSPKDLSRITRLNQRELDPILQEAEQMLSFER